MFSFVLSPQSKETVYNSSQTEEHIKSTVRLMYPVSLYAGLELVELVEASCISQNLIYKKKSPPCPPQFVLKQGEKISFRCARFLL